MEDGRHPERTRPLLTRRSKDRTLAPGAEWWELSALNAVTASGDGIRGDGKDKRLAGLPGLCTISA